jgi:hypothetical protein
MPEIDRSFLRDLKNLDRRLGMKFNGEHFVVTYERGLGQPVNILRIRGENGSFRQPDQRDLKIIKGGDLAVKREETYAEAAYKEELVQREITHKRHENFRDMTKDGKNQLAKAFTQAFNHSKGNATFRRIDHKPGKNVVRTAA